MFPWNNSAPAYLKSWWMKPEINNPSGEFPVILFDGFCNLCNASIRFILKRDLKDQFRFAPLQSPAGQSLLHKVAPDDPTQESIVLVIEGKVIRESTAFLKILTRLPGWRWAGIFLLVPPRIRDGLYRFLAKRRYRWFGKRDQCMVSSSEWQDKFLEV